MRAGAMAVLGDVRACRVNCVPQLLAAMAMDALLSAADRARDARLSDIKGECRAAREAAARMGDALMAGLGSEAACDAYNLVLLRYDRATVSAQSLTRLKLREDARNQCPGADEEAAALLALAAMFARRALSALRGLSPLEQAVLNDGAARAVREGMREALAIAGAAAVKGYAVAPSKPARDGVASMANEAWRFALYADEDARDLCSDLERDART